MAAEPILSQNLDSRNKSEESKKKKRSIRFTRVSNSKASSRGFIMSPINLGSDDDSSQQQSSSVASSDSIPNYIKPSSSFIANKGGNELDDANSVVSSSSGSTDVSNSYSLDYLDESLNHSKTDGKKKTNLRNAKVLIKNVSFKPKRTSRENEVDSYVNRATCSSIIKDSRFPEHVEIIQQDEKGSDRISDTKVCRYHHCSLNGHCHDAHPLVKKFSFRRRQQVKPQINTKKSNTGSKPGRRLSADRKELKKPEITESVGAATSTNKNTLMKNRKGKAFKEIDSNLKSKSSDQNIPSGDSDESRKDSNESSLIVNNEESMSNQVSTESTQVPRFSRGKQISMWNLIHKKIISSLEEGDETHVQKSVIDEEKQVEQAKKDNPNGSYRESVNNVEEKNQELEIRKLFAIKLVREAIENILLPEVQDQSSETQSITSDTTEDPQFPKDNHQEDNAENNANFSTNSGTNSATPNVLEDDKSETKRVKSDKKSSPNNWSSLKKWIILQRFVKALEKLKQYKPKNQIHLPLESDQEGEKVYLKRQTVDERKRSEEWMLDYAIRQAVSQLGPTQKKKVTLLVKAFETIVPPQDDHIQLSARKVEETDETQKKARGNVNDAFLRENVPLIEESNGQKALTLSNEGLVDDSKPYLNLGNRDESFRTIRTASDEINLQSKVTENTESKKPKQVLTLSRESSIDSRLDKENYLRMWHMIYQHVASNIASKVDLLGEEEEDKHIVTSSPQVILMGERKFSKSDAVKLIQEAVDEILLHDEDVSDTQSVTSETTPDMFLYEKNRDEILNKTVSNTSVLNEEYVKEFNRSDSGVSIEETKPTLPKPKNWRKLKRLILLKRSIKAMEKARKLKSLVPKKNIPLLSDAEPEKVDLKHQMVNERKKAEQWMLDYAVQNIVTELTPARKKRVAMLVEAFEAVVPLPEI